MGISLELFLKTLTFLLGLLSVLSILYMPESEPIETKSQVDDQQWLTYWVLQSMITLFELTFAKVLECIPIWSYSKLVLFCWLSSFNGATYVYEHYLRPLMVNPQKVNVWYVPKGKDPMDKLDDIITAAEKYIQEHGTGEYMLDNAEMHRRNGNGSSYYGYAEEYEY